MVYCPVFRGEGILVKAAGGFRAPLLASLPKEDTFSPFPDTITQNCQLAKFCVISDR
jgi:hypothetical protein